MKKLILLLLLIPQLVISQDSWFKLEVQFDYYADDESFALITQAGDTLVNYQPANPFEFYSTVVQADSGELAISLLDSWGDGWQGGNQNTTSGIIASIKLSNECQGTILDLDVTALGNFSQYDTTVNLLPCPPPVCSIDSTNAYQQCLGGEQALVVWEWENGWCEPVSVKFWNEEGWGPYTQGVPPYATNFGMLAGNGQMPPNWEVEHYLQVEFADGTFSDTITYTPDPCISGCMDPTSNTYNPWATIDDGSCSGTTCDPASEYQVTMQITLDNWPSETSWIMVTNNGPNFEVPVGTYDFNDIGQTYTYNFCVNQSAGFELIVNDTYGDGMVGTQQSGPGSIVIFDCAGDTIWEMDDPDFGNVLYSGQQFGNPCPTIPDVYGCTDPAYQEYNDTANIDDGSCANLHVIGCTDTNSINYDPLATQQAIVDSCEYTLTIEDAAGDGWGNSYIGLYQGDTAIGTYTMGPGPYSQSWTLNLPTDEPLKVYYFEVGNPQQQPQEVQFQTWHNSFILENADGVVLLDEGSNPFANNGQGALQNFDAPFWTVYEATPYCGDLCIPIVEGCMDSTALNYNPDANVDDGTCIPYIEGCMNDLAFNYDPNATVDDGSCIPVIVGCMDPTAFNYIQPIGDPMVDVNTDDPSLCIPVLLGCTDPTSFNYDANANTDDGSCVPVIEGCTDPSSFNYDSTANTDDGSCIPTVLGCTDPQAFNYDPAANTDDGSCIAVVYGCTDPNAFNYDPAANTDNGSCEAVIYGCTDSTSFNYDPLANTDNGSCIPIVYGCMDENSFNYDPNANVNQVSETDFTNPCVPIIYGCMDSTSVNYNPEANVDNGSCIEAVVGCTDPNSYNYNPEANVADDESCLYDAGCITGPGEPYWLNNQCYAWVIDVDDYCCDNDWDPVCQEMYNYCEQGWPDGISIDGRFSRFSGIVVYPNPAEDLINITSNLDIKVNLYDISGKILRRNITDKTIDLSDLPSGVYFLNIEHEGNIYNKRIIKE
jgi:hypothetical protein